MLSKEMSSYSSFIKKYQEKVQNIPESLQASHSPDVDIWKCYLNTQQAEYRNTYV